MRQFLSELGRKVAIINLDPANELLSCSVEADIRDLISLEGAATTCELGPNGALVYCMEYLEANLDWLLEVLDRLHDSYVLIDMPGQVELYTHHGSVRAVVEALSKANHRLTAVHLVDAHHCSDPAKFIAVLLVTLSTMVQLEMPQVRSTRVGALAARRRPATGRAPLPLLALVSQVNLLSKIDLIETYGELAFGLDFYTDVLDPSRLLPLLLRREGDSPFAQRHARLNEAIVELIDDFSLVNFGTLNITEKESVARALKSIDKANGYCFGDPAGADAGIFTVAAGLPECDAERVGAVQERYMHEADLDESLEPG